MDVSIIPQQLRDLQQWVCWRLMDRDGKLAKVPFTPEGTPASVADPNTWTDFETALEAYRRGGFSGIGFVLTREAGIVCVDIDDARILDGWNPETKWKPEAMKIVLKLDSYTEISPSRKGLHIWCYGHLPAGRRRKNGVEMYDSGRFITVTGKHLLSTPTKLHERTAELAELHRRLFGEEETTTAHKEVAYVDDLTDAELLERAFNANNGEKLRALWNGDTSGYDSQSEADLALCRLLAFWCGNDPARIERLFSQSALGQREKWRTRPDYRERTIRMALQSLRETYNGNGHRQNPRQLRQIDRTDANTSWADNLSGIPESRATDHPGATGAGISDDEEWIPEAVIIRPSPLPLPEGKGDDADTVGGEAAASSGCNGEAATPPLCTHEAKEREANSPVSLCETGRSLSLNFGSISTCGECEANLSQTAALAALPDEANLSRTAALDVTNCCRNEASHVTKRCRNEASVGDSVADQIVAFAAAVSSVFTFAELSRSISASLSALRSALYRLVRGGKIVRRGRYYSLPSSSPDRRIVSAREYADRLGMSPDAARQRLSRMVRDGKAVRLGVGRYLLLGEGWRIIEVEWDSPVRDDHGREYVNLYVDLSGYRDVIRFYLNLKRMDALEASSAGFGGYIKRACVILSPVRRGRREFWDCIGILSSDRSKILWLRSDNGGEDEAECAGDDTVSVRDFAALNGISEKAARLRLMRLVRERRAIRVGRGRYLVLPDGWKAYKAKFKEAERVDGNIIVTFELDDGRSLRTFDTMAKRHAFLQALGLRVEDKIDMGATIHICVAERLKRGRRVYDLVGVLSQDLTRIIYRADIRQDQD
jgi:hypothetical protein